ncbi:putative flippase AglR [uncultured archaeon]|nr:putative flippase AglR [uncultured archaeon]
MNLSKIGIKWFLFSILTAVVSFLGMIYFSRILGAKILGIYFLFLSVLTVFNLFTNIGLQSATIKRISEGTQQSEIATASLLFRLGSFTLFALIILVFEDNLDTYMGAGLSRYLILILGLTQFSDIFREILHGEQKVDIGGAYDFIQQFMRVAFQSSLIFLGFEIFGMIMGLGIGILISVLVCSRFVSVSIKTPKRSHFESLFSYSKFSFGNALGGYLYEWVGILVIGFFLTQEYAGVYGVAWGLSATFLLLSHAVANSIYPRISELSTRNKKDEIAGLYSDGLIYSPLLVIPGFFGALVVTNEILGTIYGEDFKMGYTALIILMLARVFQSMQIVSVRIIEGINQPNLVFRVNTATTIINIIGTFLLVYIFGFIGAAISTVLTIFISFVWNTKTACKELSVKIPAKEIAYEVFSAIVMGIIVFGISKKVMFSYMPNLIIAIFIGAIIYFAVLLFLSEHFRSKCLSILNEIMNKNSKAVEI